MSVEVTVAEVEAAASTLEKVSRIFEYAYPHLGEWSAADLRAEIAHIRSYEEQHQLRCQIASEVSAKVIQGTGVLDAIKNTLLDYEVVRL